MTQQVGITYSQVQTLINQYIRPLESNISSLDSRLQSMEEEMANVEAAVKDMYRGLDRRFTELVSLQESTKEMTKEQLGVANVQLGAANGSLVAIHHVNENGFLSVRSGVDIVSQGVDRMAQAIVQTEVIRLLHEAKEPIERAALFSAEIEQRFTKAVENVHFVHSQYDQLFATAMAEYGKKLRVIGDHIYKIYDEDFKRFAEVPLCESLTPRVELPIQLGDAWVSARTTQLQSRFERLRDNGIAPFVNAHRTIEHTLSSKYAAPSDQSASAPRQLYVPMAVRVRGTGASQNVDVFGPAKLRHQASFEGEKARVHFVQDSAVEGVSNDIAGILKTRLERLHTRKMTPDEITQIKQAFGSLAQKGLLERALIPGLEAYLDQFGLDVISNQEDVR